MSNDSLENRERLAELFNRIPNKDEFIDDLEAYVENIEEEDTSSPAHRGFKYFLTVFLPTVLIIVFLSYKYYTKYHEARPVSLNKLVKLHTQNKVTKDILVKHMYAKPHGEAIVAIRQIADTGNMHAQNIACWVYSEGINVTVDHILSAEYCHKAAAQNHSGAQMNLGVHYAEYANPKNIEKAIHYYTLAAEHRANASWYLSNIYENYPAPIRDFEKAAKFKINAADLGNSYAMMSLAKDYEEARIGLTKNHGLALKYYKMAVKAKHIDAHAWLASFYRDADPEYKNYKKMLSHAKKAMAFNNHPAAFNVLGGAYLNGYGVEKDELIAARYYSMGAKRGDEYAIYKLSYLKSDQIDINETGFRYRDVKIPYAVKHIIRYPENFNQLMDIMSDASVTELVKLRIFEYYADGFLGKHDDGYVSLTQLSRLYSGQGYSANLQPIIKAYETAAEYTSGEHAYELALIYMSGSGVERSSAKSLEWISKALDSGQADEYDYVGLYYQGPDKAEEKETEYARNLLRKAASQGSEVASETLGVFYRDGIGVKADKAMALFWFNNADKGRSDKGDILYALRKNMSAGEISKADYLITNCQKLDANECAAKLK